MSFNLIRRAHDDPQWSGRLVEGSDGGWDPEDCTAGLLSVILKQQGADLAYLSNAHKRDPHTQRGALPMVYVEQVARIYEHLDNVQRHFPWVEGWCVVRNYNHVVRPGLPTSEVITAHTDKYQAETFCLRLSNAVGTRDKYFHVDYRAAPVNLFIHPEARFDQVTIPGYTDV